ncbi:hypothetical protein NP233_g887 [Leucocoprinus birnbaumii]|uniref:Protein kinase domain-containing protein n=1 Tax=Leucocoprinus birnbaumii TaxID=56174 RepID=A0AAD5W370_9AGAR|nr:hypothetical protein NP233_g887 [Leucocoprinus birnbaumii]
MASLAPSWSDETVSAWIHDNLPPGPYQLPPKFALSSLEKLEACDFKVAGLSNGASPIQSKQSFIKPPTAQEIYEGTLDDRLVTLPAPEVLFGGPWGEKADIWSFGYSPSSRVIASSKIASIFFIIFSSNPHKTPGIHLDYMFWTIMGLTDQCYPPELLAIYPKGPRYFEPNGDMKCFKSFAPKTLEEHLEMYRWRTTSGEQSVGEAGDLMRRCLKLDPSARPSVQEILQHPWLKDASP